MKKLFLCAAIAVFGLTSVSAQNFGLKAGADFASMKFKAEGASVSTSETGFYIGAFADIDVSESFVFQPSVMYVSIDELDQIAIPLMAKIPVSEEFSVLAGPSLGILLDTGEGVKSLNFGVEAGAAYDISEQFFVEARYSLGLANLIEDAPSGYSSKLSGFFVGVGYKL
ncbi:PorT family protein [Algibacter amylolyticus]|uniref:PorT family protein n=1 Tax=Algibacter amylolyticus TaxID=1608400 RepID=A0A5M7B2J5_9FLAO|nr:porin family protein [Algibacter amylolyticus]KAA5823649.1 PorT family protein [Algibacter amylolyticus]MBB5267812.1 opacity protein-like surface antigen [Algibacter amylolyticus]TSJ74137.1 PorT family protein [Algibacter amylolyticus]